ncbi:MAG: LCP family protein [Acetobacter sp.]|nr:LCP family protein [Bacteroides sp.]MCM1341852.1 LCP family protein [Acetobacter sp.]MCM1434018.1 LCP family protein [Clostridiales bacterium]
MPRFENEGYNPLGKRNENDIDRTVPDDENYYGYSHVDLDFNSRERNCNVVTDNQGVNPCDNKYDYSYNDDFAPPVRRAVQNDSMRQSFSSKAQTQSRNRNGDKNSRSQKKGKGKLKIKSPKDIAKIILLILLALIILVVGCGVSVINKINYKDKQGNEFVESSQLMQTNSVKNILLLGVDARSDDDTESSRSDVMMMVSVDSKHNCIKMTSFLRDTWVYIPTLDHEQRLNAACSSGGYQGVVDAIEYNFGVAIDGYAVVDFEMFKVLVDSLGGVEVDVTKAEAKEVTSHPKRYGNVTLDSGKYKLTGEQALAYCRIRKIDTDFVRTKRQRTVMSAILGKAKKSSPIRLYSMASKSAPYIETNLTKGELFSIALKAAGCLGGEYLQDKVPFESTWWYDNINGNSVISINVEKNKEKLIDYIYNKSAEEILAEHDED